MSFTIRQYYKTLKTTVLKPIYCVYLESNERSSIRKESSRWSKMGKPNPRLEEIANKADLTIEDLDAIKQAKRQRKVQYRILAVFETIVGLISFIYGYSLAPFTEELGYPFFTLMIAGNVSLFSQIQKKKPLLVFIILTLVISMVGVVSGYTLGSALKTTNIITVNGSAVRYGVYSDAN